MMVRYFLYLFRAADWNLSEPDWTGRMRLVVAAEKCLIKLEDKISGNILYTVQFCNLHALS